MIGMDGIPQGGLVRRQVNEFISADDPEFDQFMAMRWTDFRSFTETFVFSCKQWDESAPLSLSQVKDFLESLKGLHP